MAASTTLPAAFHSARHPDTDRASGASTPDAHRYRVTGATRPAAGHRVTWVLPDDPSAVPEGRHRIRMTLTEWRLDDQVDLAELLADELITNALLHAWGKPLLTLSLIDGTLRCEVNDLSPELPRMRLPDAGEEHGRGLQLLDQLSARWGSVLTYTGKVVWFEITGARP
ncbi:hypothetical protein Psi02_08500 [Planotetraspora silvatica]|uniref:ATP-binding protein n=1 Tax=Planotetraspora silvatica TaxID=234614 RepID=A0A8J3UH75_9ACTN|nr:ATP-binding protein [Planotetraspora silvatica]GII44426.1 hypothetical protein Psi02_08500 [Planotetraspora silvatica]